MYSAMVDYYQHSWNRKASYMYTIRFVFKREILSGRSAGGVKTKISGKFWFLNLILRDAMNWQSLSGFIPTYVSVSLPNTTISQLYFNCYFSRLLQTWSWYFFYVCGVFISAKSIKHKIFEWNLFCLAYNVYFSAQVGDKDKTWALHVVRRSCRSILEAWYRGENWRMKFGVPRIWHKSTDHLQNCYFCKVVVTSHRQERKRIFSTIPTSLHLFDQLSLSSQMKSFPNCPASILPDCSSNENNVWWCRAWWYLCCTS